MCSSKGLRVFSIIILLLVLVGCGKKDINSDNNQNSGSKYNDVTGEQLQSKIKQSSDMQMIDVRSTEEFADGHIKGSVNIPLDQLQDKFNNINKEKEVILICASGNRSAAAAEFLVKNNYSKVYNLRGGLGDYPGALVK